MYRQMAAIREFEERANDLYLRALMPGLTHLYQGEEAVAVGICEALRPDDYVTSTHRGHGHCLAKGATPDLHVRRTARQGSRVLPRQGRLDAYRRPGDRQSRSQCHRRRQRGNRHRAPRSPSKTLGNGRVCVCFFGEGALGQGLLYEVMNIASLWKLPVIYVCENNMYNEYTHYSETTAGEILARPAAFGIPGEAVDGQDVRGVYAAASEFIERARQGKGPGFLLCNTYRYRGHHVGDIKRDYYRTKEEEQEWMKTRDPDPALAKWMIGEGLTDSRQARSHRSRTQDGNGSGRGLCHQSSLSRQWMRWNEDVYA